LLPWMIDIEYHHRQDVVALAVAMVMISPSAAAAAAASVFVAPPAPVPPSTPSPPPQHYHHSSFPPLDPQTHSLHQSTFETWQDHIENLPLFLDSPYKSKYTAIW